MTPSTDRRGGGRCRTPDLDVDTLRAFEQAVLDLLGCAVSHALGEQKIGNAMVSRSQVARIPIIKSSSADSTQTVPQGGLKLAQKRLNARLKMVG